MEQEIYNLFPENGLNQSLHLPVLLGLLIVSFFRETFGWTFAGLVVPGYLASVAVAAPVTAGVIVVESFPAYFLALLVGKWLPRTGAWSTFFGRERFLLLIVTSLLARLFMEAVLLPEIQHLVPRRHSRELYSLGLVLVPLLANSYWNAGLGRSFGRVMGAAALTWWIVDAVLLRYTNFSVARFQMANESVSLAFMEAPHAHIILLTGAVLGATNNVRYGWDYNGILVPALLAVAWYQPSKLFSTIVEAVVVYGASLGVTKIPPFSGWLLVGSRRLLVTFLVGFFLKLGAGYAFNHFAPQVRMIDYFGFGYLLPTLLATKMWNTGRIAVTTMATLQVSLSAFILGNALSFGLNWLEAPSQEDVPAQTTPHTLASYPSPVQLMLVDTAPEPFVPEPEVGKLSPGQHVLRLVTQMDVGASSSDALSRAREMGVGVGPRDENGWRVFGPIAENANRDQLTPRVALRREGTGLLVVESPFPGSPLIGAALFLAADLNARAVVVARVGSQLGPHDRAFASEVYEALSLDEVLRISGSSSGTSLHVTGRMPKSLELSQLTARIGEAPTVKWEARSDDESPLASAPLLELSESAVARVLLDRLPRQTVEKWSGSLRAELERRLPELTFVEPGRFRNRSIEELRLFSRLVASPHFERREGGEPSELDLALAGLFGYRLARIERDLPAWVLFEPAGRARQGNPTWVVVQGAKMLVEIPAPRWEVGTSTAALSLQAAARNASVLVSGATPDATADGSADVRQARGMNSFFQRIHELSSNEGQPSVSVHGISPDRPINASAYLSFRESVEDLTHAPEWASPILKAFEVSRIDPPLAGEDFETSVFLGLGNPQMKYSREFGGAGMVLVWLAHPLRLNLLLSQKDTRLKERLIHLGAQPVPISPSAWLEQVQKCRSEECSRGADCKDEPVCDELRRELKRPRGCSWQKTLESFRVYFEEGNPFVLRSALESADGCGLTILEDDESGLTWAAFGRELTEEELRVSALSPPYPLSGPGTLFLPLKGTPTFRLGVIRSSEDLTPAFSLGQNPVFVQEPAKP